MSQHIFVSYSKKDTEFVVKLVRQLEKKELQYWMDTEIPGGEEWRNKIKEKIQSAKEVVVVLSLSALASQWVNHESTMAETLGKKIVPILIEDIGNTQLPPWTDEIQYIDFRTDFELSFKKLVKELTPYNPIEAIFERQIATWKQTGELLTPAILSLIENEEEDLIISKEGRALLELSQQKRSRQKWLNSGIIGIIVTLLFIVTLLWLNTSNQASQLSDQINIVETSAVNLRVLATEAQNAQSTAVNAQSTAISAESTAVADRDISNNNFATAQAALITVTAQFEQQSASSIEIQANRLASFSSNNLTTNPELASLLAIESYNLYHSYTTSNNLLHNIQTEADFSFQLNMPSAYPIITANFTPNSKVLVTKLYSPSSSSDNPYLLLIYYGDFANPLIYQSIEFKSVPLVFFSPETQLLYIFDNSEKYLWIYDVENLEKKKLYGAFSLKGDIPDSNPITKIIINEANSRAVFLGSDSNTYVIDLDNQIMHFQIEQEYLNNITSLGFKSDTELMLINNSNAIHFFDLISGQEIESSFNLNFEHQISNFAIFDQYLAIAFSNKKIEVWNLESGFRIIILDTFNESIRQIELNENFLIAHSSNYIYLWDTNTWQQLGRGISDISYYSHLRITPNSNYLLTASSANVRIYQLSPEIWITIACNKAGRNLFDNAEEWQSFFPGDPYHVTCPSFEADESED